MTFDEFCAQHEVTSEEREELVQHLATVRAHRTVKALSVAPLDARLLPLETLEYARSRALLDSAARQGTMNEDRLRVLGHLSRLDDAIRATRRAAASDAAAPPRCNVESAVGHHCVCSAGHPSPHEDKHGNRWREAPQPAAPTKTERCPWYEDGEHRNCHGAAHPSAKGGDTSNGKD